MVNMENAEEVMQILERFTRLKQKEIPKELDEYLQYVAKTGDTVFKWSSLKYLFREKLLNVMKHFHDTTPHVVEIPQYPNVDPFNYESMKSSLLERLELFNAAPFTIQRLCELLIDPRKQYSRIDKFMRALEKNILVVSTIEPGRKRTESENGDSLDSVVNGDLSLDVNVDIDMENESLFNVEAQNGNGNSTAVAASAADSNNSATVDVKERAAVTVSSNASRAADDDILPNPKKPRLDVEVESAEALAAEAVIIAADIQTQTKAFAAEEEKQATAAAANVDLKEKEENKENLNAEEISTTNDKSKTETQEKSIALEKEQDKEKKCGETETKENEQRVLNATADKKQSPVEEEETEVDAAVKVDSEKKAAEIEKDVAAVEEKFIVEKQEIEKGEKLQRLDADAENKDVEKLPTKSTSVVEVKQLKDDKDKNLMAEKLPDVAIASNTSEANRKTDNAIDEKHSDIDDVINDEKQDTKIVQKPIVSPELDDDSSILSLEKKLIKDDRVITTSDEKKTSEEITITSSTASEAEDKKTEAVLIAVSMTSSSVIANTTATILDPEAGQYKTTADSPTKALSLSPTATETSAAAPVAIVLPTLALNDQPMEESAEAGLNDAAAIEATAAESSTIAAAVEEIVMSEISCANIATDANELSKDEPANMEVDDTSQEEAMDQ